MTTKCCFNLFVLHEFEIETKNVETPLFWFNHRLSLSFWVKYLTFLCFILWKYKFMQNSYPDLLDPKRKWFKNIISLSKGFILNENFTMDIFIMQLWFRTFQRVPQSQFQSWPRSRWLGPPQFHDSSRLAKLPSISYLQVSLVTFDHDDILMILCLVTKSV